MSGQAPIDMVLVEFGGNEFGGAIVSELERLVSEGTIRLLDVLLVSKDADGAVHWTEADQADDDRLAELVGDSAGLLADEDARAIADELEPNSSMGMMVFEHAWASALSDAVRGADGRLIDWARVPSEAIDELTSLTG